MANLTTIQPIRYAQSNLSKAISGLLKTKTGMGIMLSDLKSVDGFRISGAQPAGTDRRVVFLLDDVWYRILPDGTLEELMNQNVTADNVLYDGNTIEELEEITAIPAFLNKEIGIAAALSAPGPDASMPTLGLEIKGTTAVPVKVLTLLSPLYEFPPESRLIAAEAKTETANGGMAVVEGRITDPDGVVGDWGPLALLQGRKMNAVQFRATLTAPQIGVSTAKLLNVSARYRSGDDIISGAGTAELISVTRDWHQPVEDCRITVRHPALTDARITAACAIRNKTSVVTGERAGTGTGERATYTLAHRDGIQFSSIAVYVDGVRIVSGWELNTEVGRLTMTAPSGSAVTVDYVYGWTEEVWQPMSCTGTVHTPEHDETEFRLMVPETDAAKSICAVKIGLELTEGSAAQEALGTGTGKSRTYALGHAVREGRIRVYADGAELSQENWRLLDGERTISIAAPEGSVIAADYDWLSETPTTDKFIAVFG